MTKKIFAFLLTLSLIFITSSIFATTELKDSMNKTGDSIKDVINDSGNVVRDAGTTITNGLKDVGNTIGNGVRDLGTGMTNGINQASSDLTRTDSMGNDGEYRATKTASNGTIMGMSGNTWTWLILAITALAIIGLVWYYATQHNTEYNNHND